MIFPFPLQITSNSDLLNSLKSLASNINKTGYILSIVGDLSAAKIKCPGNQVPTFINDHLEIITLNGTISPDKCHLHISVSDNDCKIWAGHLEEGTIILKGSDILVGFIDKETKVNPANVRNQKKNIEIYTLPKCPWSFRAVRMLRALQLDHDEKVIDNDQSFNDLYKRSNYSSFPQIFINGEFIGGYSELAELHASGKLKN